MLRFVASFFSVDNKFNVVVHSERILAIIRRNPNEFLPGYITLDQILMHYYISETMKQSKQWIFERERAPKNAKTVKSAKKVMGTAFWNARGLFYINYLEKGKTLTGEYHALLLHRLSEEIE